MKQSLTADEQREQETLEKKVVAEERREAAAGVTPAGVPQETSTPVPDASLQGLNACEAWHQEAAEVLALTGAGTPVSPARVSALVRQAVGLVPKD